MSSCGPEPGTGRIPPRVAACLVAVLLAAACATKVGPHPPTPASTPARDTFILLPDEKGKTGAITVTGAGVERTLSEPRQAVTVSTGAPPREPFVMPEDEVRALVGPALSALPPPPIQFILYFRHDSSELTGSSRKEVNEILRAIRDRYPVDVSVVGHTDTMGDRRYNDRLSLRRARAVAALLTTAGVDPSTLDIASHGKDNPLVPTGDQVSEPRNRRVEVTVR
jgi:outer membrane protein OmpA-like peptidoglycan-associated protein